MTLANLTEHYHLYVEVTLSVCKYLCEHLHNDTCTMILFVPANRSCYLLPLRNVLDSAGGHDYDDVEWYIRDQQTGKQSQQRTSV